jgi:hypothetical protein
MAVATLRRPLDRVSAARALFKMRTSPFWTHFAYDVTADGQRFLVDTAVGDLTPPSVDLVLSWPAALKRGQLP